MYLHRLLENMTLIIFENYPIYFGGYVTYVTQRLAVGFQLISFTALRFFCT